jgi:hypothetical protein
MRLIAAWCCPFDRGAMAGSGMSSKIAAHAAAVSSVCQVLASWLGSAIS